MIASLHFGGVRDHGYIGLLSVNLGGYLREIFRNPVQPAQATPPAVLAAVVFRPVHFNRTVDLGEHGLE